MIAYLIYFLPIEVKMANNSLHSSYSADTCFFVFQPTSVITFNQNCVSLASLSHISILLLLQTQFDESVEKLGKS